MLMFLFLSEGVFVMSFIRHFVSIFFFGQVSPPTFFFPTHTRRVVFILSFLSQVRTALEE